MPTWVSKFAKWKQLPAQAWIVRAGGPCVLTSLLLRKSSSVSPLGFPLSLSQTHSSGNKHATCLWLNCKTYFPLWLFLSAALSNTTALSCFRLTLLLVLALHLQVDSGQTELVGLLRGQVFGWLVLLLYGVANTETAPHGGHLPVKLLPCDLVVKAQPAELDLHPVGRVGTEEKVKS